MSKMFEDPFAEDPLQELREWLAAHLPHHPAKAKECMIDVVLSPFTERYGVGFSKTPRRDAMTLTVFKYLGQRTAGQSQDELICRLALDHIDALNTMTKRGKIFIELRKAIRQSYDEVNEKLCTILYLMVCAAEKIERETQNASA